MPGARTRSDNDESQKMLEDAIDETVLELGIQYAGKRERKEGQFDVLFRIVNRDVTRQKDARQVAEDALLLLQSSPIPEVKDFARKIEAVYVE
jgi:hypothetical protein